MAAQNAQAYAQKYEYDRIMTASPGELVLYLYEGAIKFCNMAAEAVERREIEKAHNNIIKTQKIIEEFRNTLDMKYPVAEELDKVYVYLLERLVEANVGKDAEILKEVTRHLRSMRDNWKEVMKAVAREQAYARM